MDVYQYVDNPIRNKVSDSIDNPVRELSITQHYDSKSRVLTDNITDRMLSRKRLTILAKKKTLYSLVIYGGKNNGRKRAKAAGVSEKILR